MKGVRGVRGGREEESSAFQKAEAQGNGDPLSPLSLSVIVHPADPRPDSRPTPNERDELIG